MKKFKYGYDDLRKILITIGVIAVVSYFVIYVIGHWDIIVTFLQSRSQAEMKAILGYMIPIMPTILVNYHVAETKLSWRKLLLYITIGVAPSSFVYALGGDAVVAGNLKRIVVLLVIVAVVYLVVTYLKRRGKKKA